jgi:RimJ/RimL family protein N-acetyltransferase
MIDKEISLRKISEKDIQTLWQIAYGKEKNEWLNWNGPYFHDPVYTWSEFQEQAERYINNDFRYGIFDQDKLIGMVSAYYEDGDLQRWLDVGIILYDDQLWGRQIGTRALKLWLSHLFAMVELPHIGLTTWSGNLGMIRIAQKLGMTEEARIRKVRFWQNRSWDSVKDGVLREEWLG